MTHTKLNRALTCLLSLSALFTAGAEAREYHVAPSGLDSNDGTAAAPFRTINFAAQKALPGDTVTVHAGTYREWVNPLNGGDRPDHRILYRAAEGEKVELKGSEVVKGWKKVKGSDGVWVAAIPNSVFGNYNPFADRLSGDWLWAGSNTFHTGDVYLDEVSLYEAQSLEKVLRPDTVRTRRDPDGSTAFWFAEVGGESTTLYARFGRVDPNRATVEVAVRPTCFYPTRQGLDYITIRGFRVSQAATQWAAPTAEQVGMIATHWCKGWIIEDNRILNSRCNGITLGKERGTGHNLDCNDKRLDGTHHYIEVIFRTLRRGWNREHVGSHVVRNNVISDCEQTAICGSMGGAFSEIYGNHIFNIWAKRQWGGAEMAGIKLHGAIDTYLHHNRIEGCGYGIWLDWMAQGARVSSNLLHRNDVDLFTEVDHGPMMVDNNVMLSPVSVRENTDGQAFVGNLMAGIIENLNDGRYTPYHEPHSTEVKGFFLIRNGGHRFYNNLFIGGSDGRKYGLQVYEKAPRPVIARANRFYGGAQPVAGQEQGEVAESRPEVKLEAQGDRLYLTIRGIDAARIKASGIRVDGKMLGLAPVTGLPYELADGTPFAFVRDLSGESRSAEHPSIGPFENITDGIRRCVWPM